MDWTNFLIIFFASVVTNNIALTFFLGMCPFIAMSKDLETAWGMGAAVTFVTTITALMNWIIYKYLLVPLDVTFLYFIIAILTIAVMVQIVEIIIDRFSPTLYLSMGIFLPLITVNCIVLAVSLFMVLRDYNLMQTFSYSLGSSLGWWLVTVAMAGIRSKLRFSNVPENLQGAGIVMIIAGIMALAFMGFAGVVRL